MIFSNRTEMFVEAIPRLNYRTSKAFPSNVVGDNFFYELENGEENYGGAGDSTISLPNTIRHRLPAARRAPLVASEYDNYATAPTTTARLCYLNTAPNYDSDSAIFQNFRRSIVSDKLAFNNNNNNNTANSSDSAPIIQQQSRAATIEQTNRRDSSKSSHNYSHHAFLQRILWLKQKFQAYRKHLANKMNASGGNTTVTAQRRATIDHNSSLFGDAVGTTTRTMRTTTTTKTTETTVEADEDNKKNTTLTTIKVSNNNYAETSNNNNNNNASDSSNSQKNNNVEPKLHQQQQQLSEEESRTIRKQQSLKRMSVAQILRQQSENTHNNRRLTLSRSRALFYEQEHAGDDAMAASAVATAAATGAVAVAAAANARRPTSSNDAYYCDENADGSGTDDEIFRSNGGKMSSIMLPNAVVLKSTRLVTVVDQQTNDNYIQLNQYRLMEEIGQGSYGIVKLAYNERDKNLYAMKVLDKIKLVKNFACFRPPPVRRNKAQPSAVHRNPLQLVQREIAILKKLHHPNVVKLVEVLDDPNDNYLYMVFEYVEHRSLMELPTASPLDESTAWRYFRDTLKGLEYLHFQKIVHRDIKPSNLLLSDTGQVKIADFGVSCEFEGIDAFLTGTAGTPAFMAPEALSEESSLFYSGRAQDIWSLGITLYALVFGNVPFWDAYVIALHRKIKNEPLDFPDEPKISEPLELLLLGMLIKDPGHRLLLQEIKLNVWVTRNGAFPMPSEDENCHLVTVTDEEIENCVRVIPRLDTLILVKAMGHRKRFGNPFRSANPSHSTSQSLRCRRKSSSVRDSLYTPSSSSSSIANMAAQQQQQQQPQSEGSCLPNTSMIPDRACDDFDKVNDSSAEAETLNKRFVNGNKAKARSMHDSSTRSSALETPSSRVNNVVAPPTRAAIGSSKSASKNIVVFLSSNAEDVANYDKKEEEENDDEKNLNSINRRVASVGLYDDTISASRTIVQNGTLQ